MLHSGYKPKMALLGAAATERSGGSYKKKVQLKRQPTKNKTKINKTKINRSSETLMALDNKSSSLKANTNEIKTVLLLLLLLLECLDNHGHWWLVSNSLIFSIPPVPYCELCYITHNLTFNGPIIWKGVFVQQYLWRGYIYFIFRLITALWVDLHGFFFRFRVFNKSLQNSLQLEKKIF